MKRKGKFKSQPKPLFDGGNLHIDAKSFHLTPKNTTVHMLTV
jgi:hypothetical protein